MGPVGVPEMIIILVIALIVFGPRKLPELGRSLGKSLGEFKRASNDLRNTLDEEIRIEEKQDDKNTFNEKSKSIQVKNIFLNQNPHRIGRDLSFVVKRYK